MVTNRNNNTLETREKLIMSKDDDKGDYKFQLCGNVFSITISLAKQVHLCTIYALP